jgi:hypothetical protein
VGYLVFLGIPNKYTKITDKIQVLEIKTTIKEIKTVYNCYVKPQLSTSSHKPSLPPR